MCDEPYVQPEEADLPHTEWECPTCGFKNSCLDAECQNTECDSYNHGGDCPHCGIKKMPFNGTHRCEECGDLI